jgi:hypothetical protein
LTKDSRALEQLVAKIQKQLAPRADVLHDVKLPGRESGVMRQIDVLVRERVGQYEIQIVIDCKDHKKPVNVKGVEEFDGLLRDVGAQKGVLVCPKGFTAAAKTRAEKLQIELYSPFDTDPHKWQVKNVAIPAICDFRSARMSFRFSSSASAPIRLAGDCYASSMVFDGEKKEIGTALQVATKKWDSGQFPSDAGAHENLNIFEASTVFINNGYEPPLRMRIPVDITVSLLVERHLYYGPLPIPRISGFLDQFSGKVITNAFTFGLLDAEEVERDWLKLSSVEDAPVRPVITMSGLYVWAN